MKSCTTRRISISRGREVKGILKLRINSRNAHSHRTIENMLVEAFSNSTKISSRLKRNQTSNYQSLGNKNSQLNLRLSKAFWDRHLKSSTKLNTYQGFGLIHQVSLKNFMKKVYPSLRSSKKQLKQEIIESQTRALPLSQKFQELLAILPRDAFIQEKVL